METHPKSTSPQSSHPPLIRGLADYSVRKGKGNFLTVVVKPNRNITIPGSLIAQGLSGLNVAKIQIISKTASFF